MKENSLITYFKESFAEMRQVTWPTKNQAIRLSLIVLIFSVIAAVLVGALVASMYLRYRSLLKDEQTVKYLLEDEKA